LGAAKFDPCPEKTSLPLTLSMKVLPDRRYLRTTLNRVTAGVADRADGAVADVDASREALNAKGGLRSREYTSRAVTTSSTPTLTICPMTIVKRLTMTAYLIRKRSTAIPI
jgi:hypothetical protein